MKRLWKAITNEWFWVVMMAITLGFFIANVQVWRRIELEHRVHQGAPVPAQVQNYRMDHW